MRVLFVAGGTGGHIYPALSVAKKLKEERDYQLLFVGAPMSMEERIIKEEGFDFRTVPARGLPRKITPRIFSSLGANLLALFKARKIIKEFQPRVVVGTGGFVSGPTVFIASLMGIPTLLHEQNLIPGITNRLLSSRVDVVAVSYERSREYFPRARKVTVTGNPVRQELLSLTGEEGRRKLAIPRDRKVVLAFGGSQGARSINDAMIGLYRKAAEEGWSRRVTFIHVTGPGDYERIKTFPEVRKQKLDIRLYSYLNQMPAALAAADLVISRAGAMTLAELTARGIPAILIPYPLATDNHQEKNARELVELGAAEMLLDRELTGDRLFKLLVSLLFDPVKLKRMAEQSKRAGHPDALKDIVELVNGLAC